MKNSLKQLFRTPAKTIIFSLLTVVIITLLTFSSSLFFSTREKIERTEESFSTLGMVEQPPVSTEVTVLSDPCLAFDGASVREHYETFIPADVLNFEGADYKVTPENRPYYVAYLPDMELSCMSSDFPTRSHIVEFTPLQAEDASVPQDIKITKVLFSDIRSQQSYPDYFGGTDKNLREGDVIHFCQHLLSEEQKIQLQMGTTYISNVAYNSLCPTHEIFEYGVVGGPYSTQCDETGKAVQSDRFAADRMGQQIKKQLTEVTPNFYEENGKGQEWLALAQTQAMEDHLFYVLPTNALNLLPSFHEGMVLLEDGREITSDEFEQGAAVCMLPRLTAERNSISVGDRISLPLLCSLYGYPRDSLLDLSRQFTLLNAEGEIYQPFWEAEYEVVGIYRLENERSSGAGEIANDMFLIPEKSVGASDKNHIAYCGPMTGCSTTFILPNGTIDSFDEKFRQTVSDASVLAVSYDDNGYRDIMSELQNVFHAATLLFMTALLAAFALLIFLLFFFVIKEKKRTAIERSLGMTKRQCRISLVSGVLTLTILFSCIGSAVGTVLWKNIEGVQENGKIVQEEMNSTQENDLKDDFDLTFSRWAKEREQGEELQDSYISAGNTWIHFAFPLGYIVIVLLLSLLLINRNLKIEPIYLLSGKME